MTLRFFLPFDNFKLSTKLTSAEVQARLAATIEPKNVFRFFQFRNKPTKAYEGQIDGTSFRMSRIIAYRNSFLPVIRGEISSHLDKTQVSIKMRPSTGVIIFMLFWLGVVGFLCLATLVAAVRHFNQVVQHGFSPAALIPFFMFAFGYGLITFGYRLEAPKSKRFLKQLLESKEYD